MISSSLDLLGCPCVPIVDDTAAACAVDAAIREGRGGYAVAINAEKILFYQKLPEMRDVIERAALPYPDGFGAVLALKWLHGVKIRKINMPIACLKGAQTRGWRVFMLGAAEDVSAAATEEIKRQYSGINIVGRMNGFYEKDKYFAAIREARADLVMVALGSPRQELFAYDLIREIPNVFVTGCGGAFDILAGRVKRAPNFMIHGGLEWLYRLLRQPSRWQRQKFLPLFLCQLLLAKGRKALSRGSSLHA